MLRRRSRIAVAVLAACAVAAPAWAVAARTSTTTPPTPAPAPAAIAPLATTAAGVRLSNLLTEQLADAPDERPLRVFVHAGDVATGRAASIAAGLRPVFDLRSVGVVAADGPPAAIRALGGDRRIDYLEADSPIRFALDHTHRATRGEEARTVFQRTPSPKPRSKKPVKARAAFPTEIDGRGVSVAVIDSGVDGSHPFFTRPDGTSKVRVNLRQTCEEVEVLAATEGICAAAGIDGIFVDAPNNDSDTMANGGHGTHVAGIVGGLDTTLSDDRTLHGAAPGADLIALGTGRAIYISGAVPALQWVLDHHADPCGDRSCPPIRVVNNSWSSSHDYVADDVVNKLQRELIAAGVTVVWAASNDGGDGTEKLTSGYGQEPTPGALMIANYDDANSGTRDNQLDSSSSRGLQGSVDTYPDLAAPGAYVLSSCRAYLPVCSTGLEVVENGDYNSISGTSMAAPHIAGIVAQLLQVDPTLTPAEVEDVLEDTAHRFTAGGPYEADLESRNAGSLTSFDKGHGLVDVVGAVARLLGVTAPSPLPDCPSTGPVATDPQGDASGALGVSTDPALNEPGLDITSLALATDASDLVATVAVSELGDSPSPTSGQGEYFDINFTHDGRKFYLAATRGADGTQAFELGYYPSTRQLIAADLKGEFSPATRRSVSACPSLW
jgi:subtilisin family serine protease